MKYGGILREVEKRKERTYIKCMECDILYEDDRYNFCFVNKCPECGNPMDGKISVEQAIELVGEKVLF